MKPGQKKILWTSKEKEIFNKIVSNSINSNTAIEQIRAELPHRTITAIKLKYYNTSINKTSRKCRPYTENEKQIIIGQVKNYPTNLLHAFKEAEKLLPHRNANSISMLWYNNLRKNSEISAITCGSEKGFTQNVKNKFRNEDGTLSDQGLKHYLYVVKELLNLPNNERQLIVNLFTGNTIINQNH